jgi:hypothetical protein
LREDKEALERLPYCKELAGSAYAMCEFSVKLMMDIYEAPR